MIFDKKFFGLILVLAIFSAMKINGSSMIGPQPLPEFKQQGFEKEEALSFKEALSVITRCFDHAGTDLIKELGSIIDTEHKYEQIKRLKGSNQYQEAAYSESKERRILPSHEKFEAYFKNDESSFKTKLDEFKQAKNLLLEILGYVKDRIFFENAFLKLSSLVDNLENYNYESKSHSRNPKRQRQEEIESKREYIQTRMIEAALIFEFKNELFRFLQNYFEQEEFRRHHSAFSRFEPFTYIHSSLDWKEEENPLPILNQLSREQNKIWINGLNIKNLVNFFSHLARLKNAATNTVSTIHDVSQNPFKALTRSIISSALVNGFLTQGQAAIDFGKDSLSKFDNIDMVAVEKKIKHAFDVITVINQPAVWKLSTFLIKFLPRFLMKQLSPQAQIEKEIENEIQKKSMAAFEKFNKLNKNKKNLDALSKILQHLIEVSANVHPAIQFLNRVQEKAFNNVVPYSIAVYITTAKDMLLDYSKTIQEKVDTIKALQHTLEVDKKNKNMGCEITSLNDWALVFKNINEETSKKYRQQFYKHKLSLLSFLILKAKNIPKFDTLEAGNEIFYSSVAIQNRINISDPLIQNHLQKVYQTVDEQNVNYLQKIIPNKALQAKVDTNEVKNSGYGKALLLLNSLKNIETLFKYEDQPAENNDKEQLEKENFKKIFCHLFPGTQNLKFSIQSAIEKSEQKVFEKTNLRKKHAKAQEFLRQFRINKQFYEDNISSTIGYFPKQIFTKVVLQLIKLLSFFIDEKKILTFFDALGSLTDNVILQKEYETFMKEHQTFKESAEKMIHEYTKLDETIRILDETINEKQDRYKALKDFRNSLKAEIDMVWSLR